MSKERMEQGAGGGTISHCVWYKTLVLRRVTPSTDAPKEAKQFKFSIPHCSLSHPNGTQGHCLEIPQ